MADLIEGYRPGALAGVLQLHMDYYAPTWGFGLGFEAKLAAELSAFLTGFDPARDLFATVWRDGRLIGSISMDVSGGGPQGAHLRWFVVSDAARGSGLGRRLLDQAMAHADAVAPGPVWLTTFSGLDAARALYERCGFRLVEETERDQWQGGVTEQLFIRPAPEPSPQPGKPGL